MPALVRIHRLTTFIVLTFFFIYAVEIRAQSCCTLSTSETTTAAGTYSPYSASEFLGAFQATVSDQYGDVFDKHYVYESSAGPGSNSCYYPGSPVGQHPIISGGYWLINDPQTTGLTNTYGYDAIGFSPDEVNYIRENMIDGVVGDPCTATVYQTMNYGCDSSVYFSYWDNTLNSVLYSTKEVVSRDQASITINH